MQPGDLVRLKKSHPAVQRWRKQKWLAIGQWAEAGTPLLFIGVYENSVGRCKVLGPDGSLASFDDYLLTTRGLK